MIFEIQLILLLIREGTCSIINYNTLNDIFMLRFSELTSFFKEQFDFWESDNIPQHCFLGDILNSYVTELLRKNNNKQQIEKVFEFYEEMANSNDWYVKNLLQVTLLEYLWDEKIIFERAVEYMLPETKKINALIVEYLREPK